VWQAYGLYVKRLEDGCCAHPILAGNMIKFFHLEDTPMAKHVEAQAKVAVW
jgi:hypothetical protein